MQGDSAGKQRSQSRNSAAQGHSKVSIQVIDRPAGESCIEVQLVSRVARLHSNYLESVNQSLLRHLMASLQQGAETATHHQWVPDEQEHIDLQRFC
jgi:hypothetical protein